MDRRIHAIVLNYKHAELAWQTCRELLQSNGIEVDVLIVDCASGPDDERTLRACAPQDRLLLLPDNRGYAGGMNAGIQFWLGRAPETPIMLVTPDARVPADAASALWDALNADATVGAVGPVIVYAESPAEKIGAGGRLHDGRIGMHATVRGTAPYDVDWVEGCCWLLRPDAVRNVNGLNEEYFLYYEEIDLCHRLTKAGWRVQLVPDVWVRHLKSAGQQPPHFYYYMTRNGMRFWQENFGLSVYRTGIPILGSVGRLFVTAVASTILPGRWHERSKRWRDLSLLVRGVVAGSRDYLKGRYGPYAASTKRPG